MISGAHLLNNQALAAMIGAVTGIACDCVPDFAHLPPAYALHQEVLLLVDCQGCSQEELQRVLYEELCGPLGSCMVALFNVSGDGEIVQSCLQVGVRGVFPEQIGQELFIKGVRALFKQELWYSRDELTRFVLHKKQPASPVNVSANLLTQREIEILSLVAVGAKNDEIAARLYVSPHTVKTHLYNIYKKIGVASRLQATLWAAKYL